MALLNATLGYPFVLPDMIGGNGYSDDPLHESEAPEVELYIRWFQVKYISIIFSVFTIYA